MSDVLVVGAGQLGLMMAAAGARYGISVDRIDHTTGEILPGTSRTRIQQSQTEIKAHYPVITAELEHLLGNDLIENLASLPAWQNGEAMTLLPARDEQKALLDQLEIPTAPWAVINNPTDLAALQAKLGEALIVKTIRDGYDGKGQWRTSKESNGDIPENAFGHIIAEKKINFKRELSIIGARFPNGECHYFPLAENYHQSGMLRYTLAPAIETEALQQDAEQMLSKVMQSLNYTGVMAMEMFQTEQGQEQSLSVNEIAPRVHNSGHWTQLGADYSQFDLHLFALTNRLPPKPQRYAKHSLMLNLIGCEYNPEWQTHPGIQCYWYGKSYRENRKLGHINIARETKQDLTEACHALQTTLDVFHAEMLQLAINRLSE